VREGRTVFNHCLIVGSVAEELIKRLPLEIRLALFPQGSSLIAATHDIGKVSPCFYEKIRRACTLWPSRLPVLAGFDPEFEKQWGGHAGVSEVSAKAMNAPRYVPEILGQHHGFSPRVDHYTATAEVFGDAPWQNERAALVAALKAELGRDWPEVASVAQARVLAGLTSVADWIGSGEFFENPENLWRENISRAVDHAGFIPPAYRSGLSFQQIFGFEPRPIQQALIDQIDGPGVYVLEAPMGNGKTEAALYAAYRLLEKNQASGIYFALPTQLTSNKIHERFNEFLRGDEPRKQGILADACGHRSLLLHGKAWLLETEMGEEGRPGGAWFHQSKRGLLAPFAVGTVDQALMAAMNVKHGFVRAFGLMGKVVILDEVHTYDAYTGTLLNALVDLLRDLHCTVIILSATLNRSRREELLGTPVARNEYPLITAADSRQKIRAEMSVSPGVNKPVAIRMLEQERLAIDEVLARAQAGQQVLWIENSVIDAQERYLDLAARAHELGVACGLLHSRFIGDHRQTIEDLWVNRFGKDGWATRSRQGCILIGTQILEQSLDIDADFLVSRFAPTDMLLQRLGRLWRHDETPRASSAVCEAWIVAPGLALAVENPVAGFGRSAHVYSSYVLCRSLEVWQSLTALKLPTDIRNLIEHTYAPRAETGAMAKWLDELDHGNRSHKGRKELVQLASVTLAQDRNTLPESKAQTRYSEADGCEVLLLRELTPCPEERATRLTLLNGERIFLPWRRNVLGKPEWRKLTAHLMRQIVPVHERHAPSACTGILKKNGFQNCFYLGRDDWETQESPLRVALVDEVGALRGIDGARAQDQLVLEYRDDLGYRAIKNKES